MNIRDGLRSLKNLGNHLDLKTWKDPGGEQGQTKYTTKGYLAYPVSDCKQRVTGIRVKGKNYRDYGLKKKAPEGAFSDYLIE